MEAVRIDERLEWSTRYPSGRVLYELWCASVRGEGLPIDETLSRPWLEKAAALGFEPARRELAWRHATEGSEDAPGSDILAQMGQAGDADAAFYLATLRHRHNEIDDEAYWTEVEEFAVRGSEYARRALATQAGTRPMGRWWLLTLALHGDRDASYEVGRAFETGEGVTKSRREAFEWYVRAAYRGGRREAVAVMRTYDPEPDPMDPWLLRDERTIGELALKQRHPLALYWLGVAWFEEDRDGATFDGARLIREAAASGSCPVAESWLAERYGRSPGETARSRLLHAECLERGWGGERTPATWKDAARVYAEAAEEGSAEAGYARARLLLLHGGELGLEPEDAVRQALDGFRAVARKHPPAACALGLAHAEGWQTDRITHDRRPALCVRWLRVAARAENARAQLELGRCYERGYGVERDVHTAREWYARAAKRRFLPEEPGPDPLLDAPVRIEALLAYGRTGIDRGRTKGERTHAVNCVRLAREEGATAEAAALLAHAYEVGRGVPRNQAVAAAWRRESE